MRYLVEELLEGLVWCWARWWGRWAVDVEGKRLVVGGQLEAEVYPLVGRDLARVVDI